MDKHKARRLARQFRREFHIQQAGAAELEAAFAKQGFTVIPFNPVCNDPDVTTVIEVLSLQDLVRQTNGFLYASESHRLVFICDKLTDEEKALVLAHEEGHYYCGHTTRGSVIGRNVTDEYEAAEFAHYLLTPGPVRSAAAFLKKHVRLLLLCILLAAILGSGILTVKNARDRELYEGEYYVTMNGEKYHLKTCVTIQGHEIRRLTRADVSAGTYKPCSVCRPDRP